MSRTSGNRSSFPTGFEQARPRAAGRANDRDRHRRRHIETTLAAWQPLLDRLGVDEAAARSAAARAEECATGMQAELVAAGIVREARLLNAAADELGLPFTADIDPDSLAVRARDRIAALSRRGGAPLAMRVGPDRSTSVLIAPDEIDLPAMRAYLERYPDIAARLCVVPPSALRAAIMMRARPELEKIARDTLFETYPELSARIVANAWQGVLLGGVLVALPIALALAPWTAMVVLHCISSIFFLMCVGLRISVIRAGPRPAGVPLRAIQPMEMPVYTVLVPLYREAAVIPELLVSLGKIVWPRSKLEIKLICETDDSETLEAIRAQKLRPYIEVVEVPPGRPRTKPKALSYALPLTTGEFVALFDAEDRPHPLQLVEAWQRFDDDDDDLACVQAPIAVANRERGAIASMFWFEYSALFRGLLPWLAARNLFMPLGGTSNHFRGLM